MTILVRYSNGGRNAPTGEASSGHERQENLRMGAYLIDDEEFLGRQYEEVFDMFPVLEEKRAQRARRPQWWSTDDGRVRTGVDA